MISWVDVQKGVNRFCGGLYGDRWFPQYSLASVKHVTGFCYIFQWIDFDWFNIRCLSLMKNIDLLAPTNFKDFFLVRTFWTSSRTRFFLSLIYTLIHIFKVYYYYLLQLMVSKQYATFPLFLQCTLSSYMVEY